MKKTIPLLLLIVAAFTLRSAAQTTSCNAGFTFSISGLSVDFKPAVTSDPGINHHYWKFGDGKISSDISPVHVYSAGGAYTVTHIIYRSDNSGAASCVDSVVKRIEFPNTTLSCNLQAKFSFERDPSQPNKVKFTNLSAPAGDIHTVKWSFGDGTSSNDFNASHVYTASGVYKVCLIIQRDNSCQLDICLEVQVQAPQPPPPPCKLGANFIWHADNNQLNKILFNNLSPHFEPGDIIKWTFGDGSSSSDINPTHIYTSPGTYNVCIRVQKKTASGIAACVKEICKQVIVASECKMEAGFTFEADATNKNKIYFKNTGTPATAAAYVQWSFGDGTSSNDFNPVHIFDRPGSYNVCLKISSSNTCYRSVCKTIEIKEPEINCLEISKFALIRSTVNCLEFKFVPAVQNPNWKYIWTFGDGTGSTDMTPSHVYPRSGNYTAFLTVYRSSSCVSTSSKVAETGACFSCNNIWVKYEYKRASSLSNTIYFHGLSNYPLLSQSWTITKLTVSGSAPITLNQANPVYTFNEPGEYRVCIRAITAGQCVKEYCEVIRIGTTECNLNAYPNPATNQVSVNVALTSPEKIHVYIFNSLNILVKQKEQQGNIGNNTVTTNVEGLVPGVYTIKIMYGNRICFSKFQKS